MAALGAAPAEMAAVQEPKPAGQSLAGSLKRGGRWAGALAARWPAAGGGRRPPMTSGRPRGAAQEQEGEGGAAGAQQEGGGGG
jgi:hypothetical protein